MTIFNNKRISKYILILLFSLGLAACGGGGGGGGDTGSGGTGGGGGGGGTQTLNGTAAGGLPVVGIVNVQGTLGNTASSPIQTDGSYSVDITGLTAPYIVFAEGTVNNKTVKFYSSASAAGQLNITSVTDYIVRNAYQGDPNAAYNNWQAQQIGAAELAAAEQLAQTQLAAVTNAVGSTGNFLTSPFFANQTGIDRALDALSFSYTGTTATITNQLSPGSSLVADIVAGTSSGTLGSTPAMQTVLQDEIDIRVVWQTFSNLFASAVPSVPAVTAFVNTYTTPSYLDNGSQQSDLVGDFISDPIPAGISVNAVVGQVFDVSGTGYVRGYWVDLVINDPLEGIFVERHAMVYDGSQWLWHGNRQWLELDLAARSHLTVPVTGNSSIQSGISMYFDDFHNYAYNQGVRSIIVTGPGLPVGGVVLANQFPNTVFAINNVQSYTEYSISDGVLTGIADNSQYTIALYAQAWNVVSTADTPLDSYTVRIPRAAQPVASLTATNFPAIVSPNSHAVSAFNPGGTVNLSWSNPASGNVTYAELGFYDGGVNNASYDQGRLSAQTSVTFDSSSIGFSPIGGWIWMNSEDNFAREYGVAWVLN